MDFRRKYLNGLLDGDMGPAVASTWTRWNREMFADMSALLKRIGFEREASVTAALAAGRLSAGVDLIRK